MNILCQRESCPVEARRRAMNQMIAEGEKRGAKFSANTEHVVTCATCTRTVGWKRVNGEDREIPQRVIWGRDDAA